MLVVPTGHVCEVTPRRTAGTLAAEVKLAEREVRGYEVEYCGSLLHWDCHFASRKVLTARGEGQTPVLFGVLDNHSRLVCHLQWYWAESAANIAHGLSQPFMKRGLPRAAMSDNGTAMTATEIAEGLLNPGVLHETILPTAGPAAAPPGLDGLTKPSRRLLLHLPGAVAKREVVIEHRLIPSSDALGRGAR